MDNPTRSPRYPQIGLTDAIERIKVIYKKEHRHKADREVIAKSLGYAGLNGKSLGIIATLKQYNLLESAGDGLKVSDDAVTIIELPTGDPERSEAIQRVAFAPKLFAEINENYGNRPPSDENLRLYLVRKGFNSKAAGVVIRTYRDTIELVQGEVQGYNGEASQTSRSQENVQPMLPTAGAPTASTQYSPDVPTQTSEGVYTLSTLLSFQRNVRAEIRIFGSDLKKSDITRLKKAVADLEGAFEEDTESTEIREDKEV